MASTGKKIATGCGIGCLLLVIILGGIGTCGYLGIKQVVDEAGDLDVAFDELQEVHGEPEAYTPPADGRLDPARVETFLAIRRELTTKGAAIDHALRTLDDAEGGDRGPIAKIKAGTELVPGTVGYIAAIGVTLRDHGMGQGEYTHLYGLAYYVMLDLDPGAGPEFRLQDQRDHDDDGSVRVSASIGDDSPREERRARIGEMLNDLGRSLLSNQRDAAMAAGLDEGWVAQLDREIDALRTDWERLPWQDGLPRNTADSLAPYRAEFEETWAPYLNALETAALHK